MTSDAPELSALKAAITEHLNAHDLLGVMDHGAPEDEHEYDSEMEDLAALMAAGKVIAPEVVATARHKWFGTSFGETGGEPEAPTSALAALAAALRAIQFSSPSRG